MPALRVQSAEAPSQSFDDLTLNMRQSTLHAFIREEWFDMKIIGQTHSPGGTWGWSPIHIISGSLDCDDPA